LTDTEKYKKLCRLFDKVLLSSFVTPEIISNTWLHMQRSHGDFSEKYSHLFENELGVYFWKRMLILVVQYTSISVFRLLQSSIEFFQYREKKYSKNTDVLFVSHLINSETNNSNDMYYHDLPYQLTQQDISTMIVLIDHNKTAKKVNNKSIVPRILLRKTLSFINELSLYFTQVKAVISYNKMALEFFINKRARLEASIRMMSSASFNSLRISKQVSKIISKVNPKYLVFTYEGHAWERLLCYEARQVDPDIKCFAYQHSSVFEYQHSIKRELLPLYNPDVILTSGLIAKEQFEVIFKNVIPIYNIGSSKSQELDSSKILLSKSCTFLVIPEGIISECILLFEFTLLCARSLPNYKFIWRLHPSLNFNQLKGKNNFFNSLPSNIFLSNKTLKRDIEICDNVIYRGSTAVISAIGAGLRPIYYSKNGEISIDPLFQQKNGKLTVSNVAEFECLTQRPVIKKDQMELIKFSNASYTPLNYSMFVSLLKK